MSDKNELKVAALLERIGQMASEYENHLADLRAEANIAIQTLQGNIQELEQKVQELTNEDGSN